MLCKSCTKEIESDSKFCVYCGSRNGPEPLVNTDSSRKDNLMSDGFFVSGLAFFILQAVIYIWQSTVDRWYEQRAVNILVHLLSLSFPLLLAYYAKGKARTVLMILGFALIAFSLYKNLMA